MNWEIRIISHGMASPNDFQLHESNFKLPNDKQKSALSNVLADIGWVQSVIVNTQTDKVIDGHLRIQLARDRGEKEVPVSYVDLDPEEEKLVLLSLDPIRAMSLMDAKKHADLIEQVETSNEGLVEFLGKLGDRRMAATSFLDGVIKRSAPKSVRAGEPEVPEGGSAPAHDLLPIQFLLSYDDRQEMFRILNAVKEKEGVKTMSEALMFILAEVLKSENTQ